MNGTKAWQHRWIAALWACLVLMTLAPERAPARPAVVAVLYPEIREPYRSVFLDIARGVSDELGGNVRLRAVGHDETLDEVRTWLERMHIDTVIALGRQGQMLSRGLPPDMAVLIGALHMSAELREGGYRGITLSPDPALILERLKAIAPRVSRVHVIYHPQRDGWAIRRAVEAAPAIGLAIDAIPANNLREAAGKYHDLLDRLSGETEALWLLHGGAVLDEAAMLPMILAEAWNRRLVVFSNNPSHVKRGALFSMYPDNYRMGRSLARLAGRLRLDGGAGTAPGMEPLRDLLTAVNLRTAEHIGLRFTRQQRREFDLVFPRE